MAETTAILASARKGDASKRGHAERFQGVYRQLLTSVNDVLDHLEDSSAAVRDWSTSARGASSPRSAACWIASAPAS